MEKYADLSVEQIVALATEKRTAFDALIALDAPTVEQVEEAEGLAAEIEDINSEIERRETAAAEAAEKFEALKSRFATAPEEPAEEAAVEEVVDEEEVVEEEPAEAVVASAKAKSKSGVSDLAHKTKRPARPASADGVLSITAAADVPDFAAGQDLSNVDVLGQAIVNRMKGFSPPQGDGSRENLQRFGVASIRRPFPDDLIIDRHSDPMEVLNHAMQESRLEEGSLTAAGWCSPSETIYDLCSEETLEGLVSVPEVVIKRGGLNYTTGPDFADFYGDADGMFVNTEAEAIAETFTKPCVTVDCPAFQEVRLDAVGLCIKIPILTNSAYPELVNRYTTGYQTAYQHRISAEVITRMLALTPAARVLTGLGSSVDDTLEGLTLIADQRRQERRMSMNRSLEVILPFWVKNMFKADIRRRTGQTSPVTDAQINAEFSASKLVPQWVYNWQPLALVDVVGPPAIDAESYPATFDVLMYPSGTFVKGTSDVINLSAVYDAASLAENVYTGLFQEEGLLVAKMCNDSDLITLPVCNAGRRGALDVTCV